MFKIKLLISLLISFFFFACETSTLKKTENKFSLAYIGEEYDGLVLKNLLISYLNSYDLYDEKSRIIIKTDINHQSNLYITNLNNTSDREKIISTVFLEVIDEKNNCQLLKTNIQNSQFYVFSESSKLFSNETASKEIKYSNTEQIVKKLVKQLYKLDDECF